MAPGTSAPPAPLLIALEGPSGVGKSRLSRWICDALPGARCLEEAYDRLPRRISLAVPTRDELVRVERRLLREERERYRQGHRWRDAGHVVVADTGFLGPVTYAAGLAEIDPARNALAAIRGMARRAAAAGTLGVPDRTYLLTATRGTIRRRVSGDLLRRFDPFQDRHTEVAVHERRLWNGPLRGVLGDRFLGIDAVGDVERVGARILRDLDRPTAGGPLDARTAQGLYLAALAAIRLAPARVKKRTRRPPTPRR